MKLTVALALVLSVGIACVDANGIGCTENSITTVSICQSACQAAYGTTNVQFSDTNGSRSCTCIGEGTFCDDVYGGDDDDYDDDDGPPTVEQAIQYVLSLIPSERQSACESVVTNAVSQAVIDCFTSFGDDDDGDDDDSYTRSDLQAQCGNPCYARIFTFANTLNSTNCIPSVADMIDIPSLVNQQVFLNLICTRTAEGAYCGELAPVFQGLIANPTPTEEQCNTILETGQCAGNYLYTFTYQFDQLPADITSGLQGVNFTAFGESVVEGCSSSYDINLESSIDGTEEPAQVSSSGAFSLVVSSMAIAFAALVALLF